MSHLVLTARQGSWQREGTGICLQTDLMNELINCRVNASLHIGPPLGTPPPGLSRWLPAPAGARHGATGPGCSGPAPPGAIATFSWALRQRRAPEGEELRDQFQRHMNGLSLSPKIPRDSTPRKEKPPQLTSPGPGGRPWAAPQGVPEAQDGLWNPWHGLGVGLALGIGWVILAAALLIGDDLVTSEMWCLERNTVPEEMGERVLVGLWDKGTLWSLKEGVGTCTPSVQSAAAQKAGRECPGHVCQVHHEALELSWSATMALGTQAQLAWGGRPWEMPASPGEEDEAWRSGHKETAGHSSACW